MRAFCVIALCTVILATLAPAATSILDKEAVPRASTLSTSTNHPNEIPASFPNFSTDGNLVSWALRQMAQMYEPNITRGLLLGANLDYLSHRSFLVVPLEMKLKLLDVILEADPDVVRVTPSYEPWLPAFWNLSGTLREHMDEVVSRIRQAGKELMIADGASEYYWDHPMDWATFRGTFISRVEDMAQRYKPEYYVVVKEPAWYSGLSWKEAGGMLLEEADVEQWLELTEAACTAVKVASPSTVTMVAVIPGHPPGGSHFPESRLFFHDAHKIDSLDVVGVDMYKISDVSLVDGMMAELDDVPDKSHWILETWDGNPDEQHAEWRKWSHADWLAFISRYAQWHHFEGVVTFYSRSFCYTGPEMPGSLTEWRAWLDQRTPAFETFVQMGMTSSVGRSIRCVDVVFLVMLLMIHCVPLDGRPFHSGHSSTPWGAWKRTHRSTPPIINRIIP